MERRWLPKNSTNTSDTVPMVRKLFVFDSFRGRAARGRHACAARASALAESREGDAGHATTVRSSHAEVGQYAPSSHSGLNGSGTKLAARDRHPVSRSSARRDSVVAAP